MKNSNTKDEVIDAIGYSSRASKGEFWQSQKKQLKKMSLINLYTVLNIVSYAKYKGR